GRRAIAAAYRAADVFVCLSEHEGFCVPLLEAWYHKVPIVAFAATAVPETLGPAGLLLADKAPAVVATAVHRVLSDPGLRTRLVEAGTARLPLFSLSTSRQRLYRAVAAIEAAGR
ncbi:MAG: glycosyltransferase, partial [Acidimicrobiales bacterium]